LDILIYLGVAVLAAVLVVVPDKGLSASNDDTVILAKVYINLVIGDTDF
jgi:hypothetical protein